LLTAVTRKDSLKAHLSRPSTGKKFKLDSLASSLESVHYDDHIGVPFNDVVVDVNTEKNNVSEKRIANGISHQGAAEDHEYNNKSVRSSSFNSEYSADSCQSSRRTRRKVRDIIWNQPFI